MAIKNENAYYKIIESTIDYINNRTIITCDRYVDEESRIYEKTIKEQLDNILNTAHTDLMTSLDVLTQEIATAENMEKYKNETEYFENNPDMKEKYDEINEKIEEHSILLLRLLHSGVDINTFKHKEYWNQLGLTEEMCRPVNKKGLRGICFDGHLEQDLASLYDSLKTRVDNPIDC